MTEIALIGKKIGMTREFYKTGQLVPVTVLKVEKARVIQVIEEDKRGYKAVQLGYGTIKNSKLTKAMKGFYAKKNTEAKKKLKEFRVKDTETYKEGNEFGLEIFKDTKFVKQSNSSEIVSTGGSTVQSLFNELIDHSENLQKQQKK
jgi:large subunit ribosomal protein L3